MLKPQEKYTLSILLVLLAFFGFASLWNIYIAKTNLLPAYGKKYTEALVGEPQLINPILISINDVDRDIAELVYSGLMQYDTDGNMVIDLASSYEISENGKEYTFHLRNDVFWHDGKKFTADDVMFTISTLINSAYSSPLRSSWQGINIEKIDDFTVKFSLNNVYAPFLEKTTLGIIPKHIWELIDPKTITISAANLNPIGTGPFKIEKFIKDRQGHITSFHLAANDNYYKKRPYLDNIVFYFYDDEEQAVNAYQNGDVLGIAYVSPKNKELANGKNTNMHILSIPKYFAVFFNQNQSIVLSDKNVRKALALAVDKDTIHKNVFVGETKIIDSPILPNLLGYNEDVIKYAYNPEEAKEILKNSGWTDKDGDGVLEKTINKGKEPTNLEIIIATSDFTDLAKTAEITKEKWSQIGVKVNVEHYSIEDLRQNIIKTRKYDALIFGEVLTQNPDPFAFWHSSQKKDPGLNLSLYSNKKVDQLLEEARQTLNDEKRVEKLKEFQKILTDDIPAIFLYSPNYLYPVNAKVKGMDVKNIAIPSKRFVNIENWYINTQRTSKY